MLKYFLHEVEEAAAKLSAYVEDPTLTVQIDDDRGRWWCPVRALLLLAPAA